MKPMRVGAAFLFLFAMSSAYQAASDSSHLTDPFAPGWMLTDTNGDGLVDYIAGKVVVPANPTAAENAAAADIAARFGLRHHRIYMPPVR